MTKTTLKKDREKKRNTTVSFIAYCELVKNKLEKARSV